jgi:hypothetical protein
VGHLAADRDACAVTPKPPYKVFVASPGDVQAERAMVADAIATLNTMLGPRGVALEPLLWETHTAPSVGEDPQWEVFRQMDPRQCDILVAIISSRRNAYPSCRLRHGGGV